MKIPPKQWRFHVVLGQTGKNLTRSLQTRSVSARSRSGHVLSRHRTRFRTYVRKRCRDRPCGFAHSVVPRVPEIRCVFSQTCAGYCDVKTSVPTTRTYSVCSKGRAPFVHTAETYRFETSGYLCNSDSGNPDFLRIHSVRLEYGVPKTILFKLISFTTN